MPIQGLLTVSPIIALIMNVIIQMVSIHLIARVSTSILLGLFGGIIVSVGLSWYLLMIESPPLISDIFIMLLTYLALSFCYWAFLNLNVTSLRIRIVRELLKKGDIGLNTEGLLHLYSPQELINRRLERLEKSKQIVKQEGTWQLKSKKLLIFVFVSTFLRKLIICR